MPNVILQRLPVALGSFIDSRVEDNMSTRRGSCMTAYSNDDRHVWRAFRRECIRSGIKSDDVKQYRAELRQFFKRLVSEETRDGSEKTDDKCGTLGKNDKDQIMPVEESHGEGAGDAAESSQEPAQSSAEFKQSEEYSPFDVESITRHEPCSAPSLGKYQAYLESAEQSEEDDELVDPTPLEQFIPTADPPQVATAHFGSIT